MIRLIFLNILIFTLFSHVTVSTEKEKSEGVIDPPNIVLFLADDMTWRDSAPYGNTEVQTPNLTKLAEEGMTFHGMYTATAMCSPTRQQLYTGMYPVRNGAYPNHSQTYTGVKSLPHHLGKLGYRVGLTGKRHFGPPSSFPFQKVGDAGDIDQGNLDAMEDFINQDKDIEQPFALVVASHQPHKKWTKGDPSAYDPETLTVPPYLVDTPTTRKQLAEYYAEITYMDQQLGKVLDILENSGEEENTIVIFTSEQGAQFPFAKWTCYENGLKTAFIIRWPGKVKPGSQNKALVQYVDVVPTLIEAAGGNPEEVNTGRPDANGQVGFDGRSFFTPILLNNEQEFREYVYGVHTTLGIIGAREPYPIRSVSDGRYKLIKNLNSTAEFSNITKTKRDDKLIQSWFTAGESNPNIAYRAAYYYKRPRIELYDLQRDPNELYNLAGDPKYNEIVKRLERKLGVWMQQQGDKGMETELRAKQRISK